MNGYFRLSVAAFGDIPDRRMAPTAAVWLSPGLGGSDRPVVEREGREACSVCTARLAWQEYLPCCSADTTGVTIREAVTRCP